jgi:acyl transferase domain-containing protein
MPFVESRALPTDEDQDLQEPIAVCGLALKFPQDACSEEGFWTMIQEKRSAMTEFPPERLNINAFHDSTRYDSLRTRGAHFIQEDVALFDVDFFSITPSEAAAMDPMQRILLETTFHAFESAGIRIEDAKGSRSSVHTGCFSNDYLQLMLKDSERLPPYAAVGASQSMLANRLSWFYDLRGPSVNLDSACSSSAMAVDLSCQLLRSGTTNMGVVAGCNLLLDPDYSTILSNMQMLSPTGLSYAFDQRANGYSRGEGVAVVILKRLSDALRDNDTVRALIRASGTNQDGRTPGITQPDANSQADLIRETYMRAGLSMRHTRLFEAHGTGTEVGDPAEISAIADCFHTDRNTRDPLHVGSVKTNIGHLEGASGIAGLIKAILAVESGVIPPNTNFESINRRLASYSYVISLPLECKTWPLCEIRRASINSFGYGGTNCHIVIDDVDSYLFRKGLIGKHRTTVVSRTSSRHCMEISSMCEYPKLLVWSGSTQSATRAMLSKWQEYFSKHSKSRDNSWLSDVAYTLDSRRSMLSFRSYAVVSSNSEVETIEQLASTPTEDHHQHPKVAFIFSGQGAQWYAMGRELFLYPIFANGIQESESILSNFGCSWSIKGRVWI